MKKELKFDGSIFRRYKDLNYRLWFAIAEFVDNSSQSYIDNRKELDSSRNENLKIKIGFDNGEQLKIVDNAYGMDEKDIEDLLHVGRNKKISSSGVQRSEFGMGLKTGGFWLGSTIELRTKKFGNKKTFSFVMDLDKIVEGNNSFEIKNQEIDNIKDSYTVLIIKKMHKKFSSYDTGRTKDILSSIYSQDIEKGDLVLTWNGSIIEPYKRSIMVHEGAEQKWSVDIDVKGKKVTGFVGLLKANVKGEPSKDRSGRTNGGFSVSRNGRNIYCFPNWWKPENIYGNDSNDVVNQRVFGELSIDNSFRVSQTKDLLIFEGDEEETLVQKLKEIASEAINKAKGEGWWSKKKVKTPKLPPIIKEGIDEGLGDPSMEGIIDEVDEFVDDVESENDALSYIEQSTNRPPDEEPFNIGPNVTVKVWYLAEARNADYLYIKNSDMNDIRIVINTEHPYYRKMVSGAVNNLEQKKGEFVLNCIFDAVSECLLIKRAANEEHFVLNPHSFRRVKNLFLKKHARSVLG